MSIDGRHNASHINSYLFLTSPEVYLVQIKDGCKRHIRTEHYTLASIRTNRVETLGSDTKVMLSLILPRKWKGLLGAPQKRILN